MTMLCERVRELLPWYLRRTSSETEISMVENHLTECAGCRAELAATAQVAWIHEQHLPADLLTEYAFGTELTGRERSVLERHLAHCRQCQEELRTAREVAEVRLDQAPPSGRAAWWPQAVAAALAIVVLGAGLWWSSRAVKAPSPTGNVAIVELLPQSFGIRGTREDVGVPAGSAATLVLVTDLALEAESHRARLLSTDDETLWEVRGLRPGDDGTIILHLPAGVLLPYGSSLLLEAQEEGEWQVLEIYPIGS